MHGSPSVQKSNPVATVYDHENYMLSIWQIRWILKLVGVWPKLLESSSLINRYVNILINVICIFLITFLIVPCVLYVVLEVDDAYDTLKFIGPLNYSLMVFMKYISLILRESDIRVCIEHIKSDWINTRHHGDRAIMIKNAEFGRRLVTICVIFTYSGCVFYHVAMPIKTGKITEKDSNMTYQPLTIMVAGSGLMAVLIMHAYGRLEILIQWIVHLVEGQKDFCKNVDERLAIIVQEHVRILRFISLVEKVLHEISLVEVVGCTLNMCFLGYLLIMEWEIRELTSYLTYLTLLIAFIFNTFIFCYIGELVSEQCERISEISYMIDWHRLPGKKALAVILMIAMSNSSVKFTAGNIIDLSMSSFGNVIKTSVAYMNMLRTLTS